MTAARHKRKQYCAALAALACILLLLPAGFAGSRAAVTETIVVDRHTGLAIGGYDPVAYFTDGKQIAGTAAFELSYSGVVWRFSNSGNRAAFAASPDVYMPKFGGYDPLGVARGVAVAGKPEVWIISGERLFLFYDRSRLEKFAANPDHFAAEAERQWAAVLQTLSP